MTYRHTPEMGEISGFGGGYEQCCQDMLEAGVNWLMANPAADFKVKTYKGIVGLADVEGDDAAALEKAVDDASKGEASGAMHHAVMERLAYIGKYGWDDYCKAVVDMNARASSIK